MTIFYCPYWIKQQVGTFTLDPTLSFGLILKVQERLKFNPDFPKELKNQRKQVTCTRIHS